MKHFIIFAFIIAVTGISIVGQNVNFERGVSLASNGKFEEALVAFRAVETVPLSNKNHALLFYNIGVCKFRIGDNGGAIVDLESAIRLYPKYERAYYALGMAASQVRDWHKAERAFLRAIEISNSNGETWFDLAFVYLATGDIVKAEAAFQNSIELNTIDAATAYNNSGVLNAILGFSEKAIASFENAVRASNGEYKLAAENLETIQRSNHDSKLVASRLAMSNSRAAVGE